MYVGLTCRNSEDGTLDFAGGPERLKADSILGLKQLYTSRCSKRKVAVVVILTTATKVKIMSPTPYIVSEYSFSS